MIWFLWILAAIIVPIVYVYNEWWFDLGDVMLVLLCVFLVGLLVMLPATLIGEACAEWSPHSTVIEAVEIQALRDGANIDGAFGGNVFCARGYIKEKPVYTVLIKTPRGLKTVTYDADKTFVQYTDETPRVEAHRVEAIGFWNFFLGDGFLDKTEYVIFIPSDSQVADDYVIDLE